MGNGRKSMGNEARGVLGLLGAAAVTAIYGGSKLVNRVTIDSKISDNEAKKKELSKGLGWLTNSDEISELNEQNAKLRAKKK